MENISPKEILISIVLLFLALGVSIFINPFIKDGLLDDVRSYQKALQIEDDSNLYQYAKTTRVGDVLAHGTMKALTPVSMPELMDQYAMIEKVTERYTMHTMQVCDSQDDDGNCKSSHTETYYTWDTYNRITYISDSFDFLSVSFHNSVLDLSPIRLWLQGELISPQYRDRLYGSYLYEDSSFWESVGDLRFYYNVLPTEFSSSVYTKFDGNNNPVFVYYERSMSDVIAGKENDLVVFDFFYYTIWLVGFGSGYYYFVYHQVEIE